MLVIEFDRAVQVLFIDEVHMLDIECFSFLNRALENELSPLVIMASNRGMVKVRGTQFRSPHGLPPDLLDRVLIVSTKLYEKDEIEQIIQIRYVEKPLLIEAFNNCVGNSCQEEDVTLDSDALKVLTSMAGQTTLRYSLNLISCAQILANKRRSGKVEKEDLRRAYTYFMDEKRSVLWLKEQQGSLIFEDVDESSVGVLHYLHNGSDSQTKNQFN